MSENVLVERETDSAVRLPTEGGVDLFNRPLRVGRNDRPLRVSPTNDRSAAHVNATTLCQQAHLGRSHAVPTAFVNQP